MAINLENMETLWKLEVIREKSGNMKVVKEISGKVCCCWWCSTTSNVIDKKNIKIIQNHCICD